MEQDVCKLNIAINDIKHEFAEIIARKAVRALLYEVSITPKPGLVDRANNGAHQDMNYFTFIDSSCALYTYFYYVVVCSSKFKGKENELLPFIRPIGRWAEKEMYDATKGVNTHKGLIFSLGIICAAIGYCYGFKKTLTLKSLLAMCSSIAFQTKDELSDLGETSLTHGEHSFKKYGFTGARGEVAAGFPNIRRYSYPMLKKTVFQGYSINDAGVVALLYLMGNVDDTNILSRSGKQSLDELKIRIKHRLEVSSDPKDLIEWAKELDKELIDKNISPGGCADLLAITIMLYFLFEEKN